MNARTAPSPQPIEVLRTLAPARRAIGLSRVSRGALLGFAGGAALAAVLLVAGRIFALRVSPSLSLVPVLAGIVLGSAVGLLHWPRPSEAARAADLCFELDDRLTTALELRSLDTPLAALQRQDALRHSAGLPLGQSRGRWLGWGEPVAAVVAGLALAAALIVHPPALAHHTAAASVPTRHVTNRAAAQLKRLSASLHLLTPAQQRAPALRKLQLALTKLRRQLARASSRRTALRAISATQQQIRQLSQSLHPINARAIAQLNGSLAHALPNKQSGSRPPKASRGARAQSQAQAQAQALSRLAQALAHLSPAQRAALARALARAANANSNTGLRASLRQAASSLAYGDQQTAQQSLQQAAQQLAQSAQQQTSLTQLGLTNSQLQSLKNQLSGGTSFNGSGIPLTGRNGQGRNGKGLRPGTGRGQGQGYRLGRGTGRGRGQAIGRGRGQGRGGQRGQGTTPGQRPGTAGGYGRGGRGPSTLQTRSGRNVTVYIPGKQGHGQQIILSGPNGAPLPGAYVPYQKVVGSYAQSAHQALDRTALPPSLQGYVRRYFSTISH